MTPPKNALDTQFPLRARNVTKHHGRRRGVLDVTVDVKEGQVHGLLGPNGSGKSTLLHVITGVLESDDGEVFIAGCPVASPPSRSHLGFAPDDLPVPGALTGREYMEIHDVLRDRRDLTGGLDIARILGIDGALDERLDSYSHGMKRKLQLVVATMHHPELLVLDEPYRGLDPAGGRLLSLIVSGWARGGRGVLVATHDMLRAESTCDVVTILHEGSVLAQGAPLELIAATPGADSLETAFLLMTTDPSSWLNTEDDLREVLPLPAPRERNDA